MNRRTNDRLENGSPSRLGCGPDVGAGPDVSEAFRAGHVLTCEHATLCPQISGVGHHP
jgi:hypothetical protein